MPGRTRRSALASLAAVATATTAGCLSAPGSEGNGASTTTVPDGTPANATDDSPASTDGADDGSDGDVGSGDPTASPDPGEDRSFTVVVESADPAAVADALDAALLSDYSPAVEAAVRDAVDGGHVTESVNDDLATLVGRRDYVQVDGEYYDLDARFPHHVLVLEPVEGEVDPEEAVGPETYREDVHAAVAVSTAEREGAHRGVFVPDLLARLVEEYEYVTLTPLDRAGGEFYTWRLVTDDRDGPPYHLEAPPVDRATVYGTTVAEYDELPSDAREEVDRAVEAGGEFTTRDPPAVLDALEREKYLRVDDEYYRVGVGIHDR